MSQQSELDEIIIKMSEAIALLNFSFWQEQTITKSVYDVKAYEIEQKAKQQIKALLNKRIEFVIGDDELIKDPNDRIKDSNRLKVKYQNVYRQARNELRQQQRKRLGDI